ncbi:MAG: 3-deoxy-manno-octulosonate cytidylyltransferase [Dissulfurispiraceae bacterium]|jgi:3-deoxy-manno-octulosonate cytidylyltransferase (CMP-KDO synthetase)|nr:3-deoxy-manno-octulosonate cytidylyltransferase [Dissulfurispiraceae bacterium]
MPAIVIIPARYSSTRFPGKPLCPLKDRPIIQHVYERAAAAKRADAVYVATDNKMIFNAVHGFGGRAVMTSEHHQSGTDRIAEALLKIEETESLKPDRVVNVQGDEPLIRPEMIDDVISLLDDPEADIGTLARKINSPDEINNPNVVKTVFGTDGFALYFSRTALPYYREEHTARIYYKHIGIYSYRRDVLMKFSKMPASPLEEAEKLEQLRALENSFKIKIKETEFETVGVDTPEDLERAERCLNTYS